MEPIRFSKHALGYTASRGFTVAEVEETIRKKLDGRGWVDCILTAMKNKFLSFLALAAALVLLPGCIGTQDGHSVAGMPFSKDRITSRYARPVAQLVAATRTVLTRNGKIIVDNAVNNSFMAKVNQHNVWVKVTDVDGRVTEVVVQARGSMSGDVDTAAEISKQIGMMLVAMPGQS
jgi:hypothetical protein